MSKAEIIESIGKGKYRVKLLSDLSAIKARISALEARIEQSNLSISGFEIAVDDALQALNSVPFPEDIADDDPQWGQYIRDLSAARRAYDNAVNALSNEKVARENARNERGRLIQEDESKESDVWCADFTVDLEPATEVGVIDWYQFRERSTAGDPVIIPAQLRGDESKYIAIRDGRKVPEVGLGVYSWWYAKMLVAGMERINPHYRKGTITAIADARATVDIDPIYTQQLHSAAPDLSAEELTLSGVPMKYLSCNALAFEVGDRVVVEYPRKNLHDDLASQFKAQREALIAKIDGFHQRITDYQNEIDANNVLIDQYTIEIEALIVQINEEEAFAADHNIDPDLHLITSIRIQIGRLNDKIITLTNDIIKINSDKLSLEILTTSTELKVIKLQTLEDSEQQKARVLKDYTDTRPSEITIIGFVENPKPCEAIAFKDSAGQWKIVNALGKEANLDTPPELVGAFNWGVKNEKDGRYDCACVWSGATIRHGGFNYDIAGTDEILGAGVIRDMPSDGMFTIKALVTTSYAPEVSYVNTNQRVLTVVVKDGVIVSSNASAMSTGFYDIIQAYGDKFDVLVDKTARYAIVCHTNSSQNGFGQMYHSKIWRLDLMDYSVTVISEYINGHIINTLNFGRGSLCRSGDGGIIFYSLNQIGMFEIDNTEFISTDIGIISAYTFIYESKDDFYAFGLAAATVLAGEGIGFKLRTGHGVITIDGDQPIGTPYPSYDLSRYGIVSGFAIPPTNARQRDNLGIWSRAQVGGFQAGCFKIRNEGTALYYEFRGRNFKLVAEPSTDYTILI